MKKELRKKGDEREEGRGTKKRGWIRGQKEKRENKKKKIEKQRFRPLQKKIYIYSEIAISSKEL